MKEHLEYFILNQFLMLDVTPVDKAKMVTFIKTKVVKLFKIHYYVDLIVIKDK